MKVCGGTPFCVRIWLSKASYFPGCGSLPLPPSKKLKFKNVTDVELDEHLAEAVRHHASYMLMFKEGKAELADATAFKSELTQLMVPLNNASRMADIVTVRDCMDEVVKTADILKKWKKLSGLSPKDWMRPSSATTNLVLDFKAAVDQQSLFRVGSVPERMIAWLAAEDGRKQLRAGGG